MESMRRISTYDASQCEAGLKPTCHCRCDGMLHGKKHAKLIAFENELLEAGKEITMKGIAEFLAASKKGR